MMLEEPHLTTVTRCYLGSLIPGTCHLSNCPIPPAKTAAFFSKPVQAHNMLGIIRQSSRRILSNRSIQKRSVHAYTSVGKRTVTLIPGDGIGPEITQAVVGIIQASNAPVDFERFDLSQEESIPQSLLMRCVERDPSLPASPGLPKRLPAGAGRAPAAPAASPWWRASHAPGDGDR